ncbi:F0F1 ATP synthase subunit B [Humisphaera borealis]|uniref:ATP synthase subunit b n=1 Tax=Humisphaera borealis TaxID=2807512 RepID=A0A7M2WUZ9_9BACT|nr:F0F1 ATP synthase subunit B [Humisphaera borealis]QOV89144.1 F0F1 ATP synthase subunit B [Humisphaera borealis]
MTALPRLSRRLLPLLLAVAVLAVASSAFANAAGEEAHKPELIPPAGTMQIITTLTTLIVFIGLVLILGKYAWGPIVTGLKAREDKIRKDIRDAEESRAKSEALLKQYEQKLAAAQKEVNDLLTKATNDAQALATSIRMNAQQESEEAKERATRDIEAAKNQAVNEIHQYAANLATSVAEKILRRNLNADDQRDLVQSSLEQLKSVSSN